jgi:glycosidase
MKNIMRFWLNIGIDGFRVDAVPYLCTKLTLFDHNS